MTSISNFKVSVNDYISAFLVLVLPIIIYFIIVIPQLFITLVAHIYLLILSLHFALEFAKCPHRILQINYADVHVDNVLLLNNGFLWRNQFSTWGELAMSHSEFVVVAKRSVANLKSLDNLSHQF